MRYTLLLLLLCFSPELGKAQSTQISPDCIIPFNFTAAAQRSPSAGFQNFSTSGQVGCVVWVVTYRSQGFTALSLRVESAADALSGSTHVAGSWGAFSGSILNGNAAGAASGPGINPNTDTNWGFTMFLGSPAWVSVTLTSETGTGSVSGTVYGWRPKGSGDTASTSGSCPGATTNGEVLFNDSGACGGNPFFTFDKTTGNLVYTNYVAPLVTPPIAPTATLVATGTGNVTDGDHSWLVTYVTATGESAPGAVSNAVTVDASHKQVNLTGIPVSADSRVVSKNIYQTKATGKAAGSGNTCTTSAPCTPTDYRNYWLLANISNATTSYTANTADASLTGTTPPFDSTGGYIFDLSGTILGKDGTFPNGFYTPNLVMDRNGAGYMDATVVSGQGAHRELAWHFCCGGGANFNNTFFGNAAGNLNFSGAHQNSGFGWHALNGLTTGRFHVAVGSEALEFATTSSGNTAVGHKALQFATTGGSNTGIGVFSIQSATTADANSAVGQFTLGNLTTGQRNIAMGDNACSLVVTGSSNVCLGGTIFPGLVFTGPTTGALDNTITVGAATQVSVSNTAVIGSASITDVFFGSETPSAQTHAASGTFVAFAFANLATVLPADGNRGYCSNCTVVSAIDNTCAGSGNGANAYRVNGVYKCFQ